MAIHKHIYKYLIYSSQATMGDNPIQVDVAWFKPFIQNDEQCWQ
jgi:hypothetical protein